MWIVIFFLRIVIGYAFLSTAVLYFQAYKDCLSNVMLSGPTLFSPIIKATHAIVNKEEFS